MLKKLTHGVTLSASWGEAETPRHIRTIGEFRALVTNLDGRNYVFSKWNRKMNLSPLINELTLWDEKEQNERGKR